MAKPSVIEARKAAAMQQHADGLTEVSRKLDLIMAKLGITEQTVIVVDDPSEVAKALASEAEVLDPAQGFVEPEAEVEVLDPAQGFVEPEPEAEPEAEAKPKGKSKK